MHLDGKIDPETYHTKLEEYKQRQRTLTTEVNTYDASPNTSIITAKTVMELAQQAKELFMSSKLNTKQQILRCIFSNLRLTDEKLLIELREPFNFFYQEGYHPKWWRRWESNPCPHCIQSKVLHVYSSMIHMHCLEDTTLCICQLCDTTASNKTRYNLSRESYLLLYELNN